MYLLLRLLQIVMKSLSLKKHKKKKRKDGSNEDIPH